MAEDDRLTADVSVERTKAHDIFTGPVDALVAAGVIEARHLEPQPGRRRGMTHFMPDGAPVPSGVAVPALLPGALTVTCKSVRNCEARRTVSAEERQAREYAESTLRSDRPHKKYYEGSADRLIRDGVNPAWFAELPLPGKVRGRRTFFEGENKVEVSVSESRISIEVTHIDYYKDWSRDGYLSARAEYGLPLIHRGHLTLVWSNPRNAAERNVGVPRHG